TFCIKYPEISDKMVTDKAADIAATGVDAVLAGDLGCLLNIAGKLSRRGSNMEVRHVAEVLADMPTDVPPIGRAGCRELCLAGCYAPRPTAPPPWARGGTR